VADVRKDEATLTAAEWEKLIAAIDRTHGMGIPAPRYRDFVLLHVRAMTTMAGMAWKVHTMRQMGMVGVNFLAWHRRYLRQFEKRLQLVDASVTIPYWDWIANPRIPPKLNKRPDLQRWGVTRDWDPDFLPVASDLAAAMSRMKFTPFQRALETIHGAVHIAVGGVDGLGTMAGASSPADPLFWLHHANVDRLWAEWEQTSATTRPPNPNEVLEPPPIIRGKVSASYPTNRLGYGYG
jgi:hypothetical protein